MNNPKISILIPTKNGGRYLSYCIDSIIKQDYKNLEIIVSNNYSTDNTKEYLSTITDERVKVIVPERRLSLTENYEFALSHATGDWVMFVGDDDGVQSYFFKLVPYLIQKAEEKNINLICSDRAYFYWSGCETLHPESKVSYWARPDITIEKSMDHIYKILLNYESYTNVPQMYTTSLFSRKFINKIKHLQNNLFYNSQPPDVDAAAIALSTEEKFLYSAIPLGWVGTSSKSYGTLLLQSENNQNIKKYLEEAEKEELASQNTYPWHPSAGHPTHQKAVNIHFWQALLFCSKLQDKKLRRFVKSKLCKYLVFASAYQENKENEYIFENFKHILKINKCSFGFVKFISKFILPIIYKRFRMKDKKLKKKYKKLKTIFYGNFNPKAELTLTDANERIKELGVTNLLVEKMISK
ncbi:putative uncharacterized protein [Brachyspira sp. CAG:484]|nr:putative uncharacterized protein [Brachyspira sp. CAG:484]